MCTPSMRLFHIRPAGGTHRSKQGCQVDCTLMLIVTSCHQWPDQEGAQRSDPSGSADSENGLTLL